MTYFSGHMHFKLNRFHLRKIQNCYVVSSLFRALLKVLLVNKLFERVTGNNIIVMFNVPYVFQSAFGQQAHPPEGFHTGVTKIMTNPSLCNLTGSQDNAKSFWDGREAQGYNQKVPCVARERSCTKETSPSFNTGGNFVFG